MNILVTNDDGIFHPGVEAMVEALQHFGNVYVICPDKESSGISHSITQSTPLKAIPTNLFSGAVSSWRVNGTPADCVKLGIEMLMDKPPDFVFSGINIGPNIGRDVYYSGTIAGAKEATLYDIPSVAVSMATFENKNVDFKQVTSLFSHIVKVIFQNTIPKGMFINVNLPNMSQDSCKGIKVAPLDMSVTRYRYVGLKDSAGQMYYWLQDDFMEAEAVKKGGDFRYLREGYITITPVEVKFNQKRKTDRVSRWFQSIPISEEEYFYV